MVAEILQCGFLSCYSGKEMKEGFFFLFLFGHVYVPERGKSVGGRLFTCVWECMIWMGMHWNAD